MIYRLVRGSYGRWVGTKANGSMECYAVGDEIECDAAQAAALGDRIQAIAPDEDWTALAGMNVATVVALIGKCKTPDSCEQIIEAEQRGKNRKSVIGAANQQIKRLGVEG